MPEVFGYKKEKEAAMFIGKAIRKWCERFLPSLRVGGVSGMKDNRLWDVRERVITLQREVDDAAWNGDPRLGWLSQELAHFKALEAEGKVYEPKF